MLERGARVPDVMLWTAPSERRALSELVRERPGLFLFYLFDWSST
jgi:hypothetical protein